MNRLWLTYAWVDNEQSDIDFLRQELEAAGIKVLIDRQKLVTGQRLWDQISQNIISPDRSDAWAIYVTERSLSSEACREELAYALQRAISQRGAGFPIIGIFPAPMGDELIPAAIASRLYVFLTDNDWKERIRAGVLKESPTLQAKSIPPIQLQLSKTAEGSWLEIRTRAGRIAPIHFAVPTAEADNIKWLAHGPVGVPGGSRMAHISEGQTTDGKWKLWVLSHNMTPIDGLHASLNATPQQAIVGDASKFYLLKVSADGAFTCEEFLWQEYGGLRFNHSIGNQAIDLAFGWKPFH